MILRNDYLIGDDFQKKFRFKFYSSISLCIKDIEFSEIQDATLMRVTNNKSYSHNYLTPTVLLFQFKNDQSLLCPKNFKTV